MILTTHKHMDHAGGNVALQKAFPALQIVAGSVEAVAGQTVFDAHNATVLLGDTTIHPCPAHSVSHRGTCRVRGVRQGDTPCSSDLRSRSKQSTHLHCHRCWRCRCLHGRLFVRGGLWAIR